MGDSSKSLLQRADETLKNNPVLLSGRFAAAAGANSSSGS
jgi:hypothetical protein